MRFFSIIFFSISFLIADTYSWEDGGTILGSYGNILESATANVGATDGVVPHDGDYMLTVSESPLDGTPIAYIAWVTDLSEGDEISACFYGHDTTPGTSPSLRIWGAWSDNDDITSYAGAPDSNTEQNNDYTAGTGWDQICHTFSTNMNNWESGEALVIQARLYSASAGPDPAPYFIDLVEVTTTSSTATIHFPGAQDPVEGPVADAGDNQTVDAGSIVTLDGSGSYHTDGTITEYYWEQVSGSPVLLDNEEAVMPTFTAPDETVTLAFDLSIYDEAGNESTDTVTISVIASAGTLTIAQIQGESDASPYVDQYVSTSGYVMAKNDNGFFLQDAEAIRSGIWVLDFGEANVSVGDEVEVSGQVEEYFNLTELKIASSFGGSCNILSSNNILFDPIIISSATEDYESVLVTVSGTCDELPNQYGEWLLSGITIDDYLYGDNWGEGAFNPVLGNPYTITGPLNYAYSLFRVNPRDNNDIEDGILSNSELIKDFSILEAYPNPFNPSLTIEFSTLNTELIEVSIYDIMGHKVENLFRGAVESNQLQTLNWDASNYSSGDYFIHLKSGNQFKAHKITLIK